MSKIKGKDTKPELLLRKALWEQGIRYRKNCKTLVGRPDVAITKYKVAVFVDSEFFHGKDWEQKKPTIERGTNSDYWVAKIERNIQRDIEKTKALEAIGYKVVRIWSKDVINDIEGCLKIINEAITAQKDLMNK